jgi:hypothetical protein
LADCLRRINSLETNKSHTMVSNMGPGPRLRRDMADSPAKTPGRRPMSGSYSQQEFNGSPGLRAAHEAVNRRSSYASNRDQRGSKISLYQSTSSLAGASEQSSPSPAPSPSPTTPGPRHASPGGHRLPGPRPLSASLHKKWSSSQDFRELSPGPGQLVARRAPSTVGSLRSLASPFGSQQNLAPGPAGRTGGRHGTREAAWSGEEGLLRLHLRGRPVHLVCPSAQLDGFSLARVGAATAAAVLCVSTGFNVTLLTPLRRLARRRRFDVPSGGLEAPAALAVPSGHQDPPLDREETGGMRFKWPAFDLLHPIWPVRPCRAGGELSGRRRRRSCRRPADKGADSAAYIGRRAPLTARCTTVHCTALHCTALHCAVLCSDGCCRNRPDCLQCSAVQCSAVQCTALHVHLVHSAAATDCSAAHGRQAGMIADQCSAVQCNAK